MKKLFFISCLLCLTAVCRAQYIGSNYLNMKVDYVVNESQVQGTLGYGKVFKTFRVGANLNYRNLNREQVQANTVTVGPEFHTGSRRGASSPYWVWLPVQSAISGLRRKANWFIWSVAGHLSMAMKWA